MRGVVNGSPAEPPHAKLLALVMSMFFAFGFCTVLVDTLVPRFKAMFSLTYTEVMLTQFCFFGAYFLVSVPAGWLLSRLGYLKTMSFGLAVMAAGAFIFVPAARFGTYEGFLVALFILAAGVTTVQVAANPLAALVGPAEQASSRLTLAQAFNSLATMIGPLFGAYFILSRVHYPAIASSAATPVLATRANDAALLATPFAWISGALLLLAIACWSVRRWSPPSHEQSGGLFIALLRLPRLRLGALCIFTYVGAEVSIGSSIANYLMQGSVLHATAVFAGSLVSLYWGLAMAGRFAGAAILRVVSPGLALAICAAGACALALVACISAGLLAASAILAIGLFNAIMFPTIFSLAIEALGDDTPEASGLVCLAIVGGAIVPVATGIVADRIGLSGALVVPAACYVWVGLYGLLTWLGALPARPLQPPAIHG